MRIEPGAAIRIVPELAVRFLPGCRGCGAVHPEAMRPPVLTDHCPGCGMALAPEAAPIAAAVRPDLRIWAANLLLALGRAILKLSKRI
jgi:hypothetical protein